MYHRNTNEFQAWLRQWALHNLAALNRGNMSHAFTAVLITVQTASELLAQAALLSPRASNLRDELDNLSEQCTRLQNALAANGYDAVGMSN
jgi:hypothetical protein